MPFNVQRTGEFFDKEILKSAAGLDDIASHVVDSRKVDENPANSGRFVLEAGTVMAVVQADGQSRVMPVHMNAAGGSGGAGAYVAADIVGILGSTVEFHLGDGITAGDETDEVVPILHHGCHFDVSQLVGYSGNESIVASALPTCKFS